MAMANRELPEQMLLSVGVPADEVAAECSAMQTVVISKTSNRRVLGSLNDLVFQLQVALVEVPDRTLQEHALWLAKTPLKLIDHSAPDLATVAAFDARRLLLRVGAG